MNPTTEEIIYQGNSTVSVEMLQDYPRPVVIKKPSKPHVSRRPILSLEKEFEMTRSLNAVEGVRKALEQQSIENQPVLILEYIDGETLRDLFASETLDLRSRLEIAVDLALILAGIHQRNVIHLDLNSKNILIGNKQQSVHIIDLGSASHIDRTGQLRVRPDQMLGTLPYISPEQTGRINRTVDERSDLYSLGVVLYELVTGQLPFDSSDPMTLIHDHIARVPVSPSEVSSEIPEVLSAIILKLLSKDADDRYQSAAGVQADLEICIQRLTPEDTIEEFPLGEADYAGWLRFPQKLYGRESELEELESAFESVCRETSSIMLVGGYSGIGKTALVEEIQRPVSERSGYFIEGKFDQLTTTPYAGISQALAAFVSQILTQPETQLTAWRSKILEAVGPNGRVLMDVVPSLELIIGPQPAVPDLSGQEAQNRFNYVFQRFFGAIAGREHPICFFLDDLQWVDPGSLDLLKALFSSPDLAHLLLVGAYRDNEVHEDHPLMTFIADLEKVSANLKQITLQKLSDADIEALISATLQSNQDETRELSRLINLQTDGNPFFTRQVLRSIEDEDFIKLDAATGNWRWDMDDLGDLTVKDSVVDLLVSKLKQFPANIQEMLKVAACIGNQFDIATLTVVTEGDTDAILDHVQEAVAAGLIWKRDGQCYFVHDRVQEAAYELLPMEEKDLLHLAIGRQLLKRQRASDHELNLFRIADQLNHGLHLIEDEQEQIQIARLNLQAARAARQASAFKTGLGYARSGLELLGETGWDQHYRLTLELEEQAALLAYMAGDILRMKHHGRRVLDSGRNPVDVVRVKKMNMEFLAGSKHLREALNIGIQALDELGFELPGEPDWELAMASVMAFDERLDHEAPDWLAMRPLGDEDPQLAAVFEMLTALIPTSFVADPALCPLLVVIYLELCLTNQCLPGSMPFAFAVWACYEGGLLGQPEAAAERCEVAARLAERPAWRGALCRVLEVSGIFVVFWVRHLRETLDLFQRSIRAGRESGDNEFSAYSVAGWPKHAFYASVELAEVEAQSLELRAITDVIQFDTHSRWVNIYVTAARLLRGTSSVHSTLWRGTLFDEELDLPPLLEAGDRIGPLYLHSTKAWLAMLFGDRSGVEEQTDLVVPYLDAATGALDGAIVAFIFGLRRARELRENPERSENEQALQEQLGLLERFAGQAPMNFAHKLSLVQAEVHRARGEILPAMRSYEKASQGAGENGYLSEAGLAHALAAEFYQDLGLRQAALHNLEQAAQAWRSWGAQALVESLDQRFADLLGPSDLSWRVSSVAGEHHTTITQPLTAGQLDLESILSASQMLSAETDLEQLLSRMMALVIANSGADRAILLLRQEDGWFVQARSDITADKHDILLNRPYDPVDSDLETDFVPETVFNYCHRSKEVLVVGDAQLDPRFTEDRMVEAHDTKSMACIPVLSQGKLRAMLYLENRQMADVFTLDQVDMLKHLSSQFGVSVENALLYSSLNEMVRELQISDERYELAVTGSTAGIWDWDISSDTVHYSDRFVALLGYGPEDFSDSLDEFWARIHPDDYKAIQQAVDQHLEEQTPFQIDYRLHTKSGEYRWFHARGQAVWDEAGKATRMSGSITDVTERKLAEVALMKSEERFRSIMEASPLDIVILTPEGRIGQVNAAWKKSWGVSEEETEQILANYNMLADKQFTDLGFMPLVERAFKGENIILPPIAYEGNRATDEMDLEDIEAQSRWIQTHMYSVKDASGEIDYLVAINMDLTKLRRAEQEALEQREALARVDRATSMGQLTGSISHELNQPLTGILSNAQAAELMIQGDQWEEEEMAEIMAEIVTDAKRAGEVIRNLRRLYREQQVEFLPVDINGIVEETIQLLHSEFIIQRVELTTAIAASMPWVNGNKVQVQQVLVNLVMNSTQAMSDKARDDRLIHIVTALDGDEVKAWVEDNGTGIDPDRIDHIFEPLATWKPGHTGMGLAISKSIITAHGGRMWAENRSEGGARVGFALPVPNKEDEA